MTDAIDENGLQTSTLSEIITELEDGLKGIYGDDINIDSNSPDGQLINIFAQAAIDIRELATSIYNNFNPDTAVGRVLDERVVINNIERQGGTFTIVPIDIVVSQTVSLEGLDDLFNDINGTGYTIQDDAGNQFILIDSVTLTAGSYTKNFRAKDIGEVQTTTGTITNAVTIVNGVTSVNNSSGALQTGQDEETDAQLRVRREASVANASTGYLNGLLGIILNLDGVTDGKIYENTDDSIDSDGIPAHGIWVIVEGGANTDIGEAIYSAKSMGCDMKGSITTDIITASGGTFTAKFDRPSSKDLYIQFDIQTTVTGTSFDENAIKSYIEENLTYNIGDFAETSAITTLVRGGINSLGGGGVPVNVEISDDGATYYDYLTVDTLDEKWTISTSNISISVI